MGHKSLVVLELDQTQYKFLRSIAGNMKDSEAMVSILDERMKAKAGTKTAKATMLKKSSVPFGHLKA